MAHFKKGDLSFGCSAGLEVSKNVVGGYCKTPDNNNVMDLENKLLRPGRIKKKKKNP